MGSRNDEKRIIYGFLCGSVLLIKEISGTFVCFDAYGGFSFMYEKNIRNVLYLF